MTLKDINFNIAMYGTEPVVQSTYSVVYTGDKSSVKVNFNVTDEADLTGATAKVHLYFADSSHIEKDAQIDGTVVHYTLKGTENDHAGPVRVDVFITMNGATYTRAGYKFRIDASLEASAPLVEYAIETLDTVVEGADEWLAQAQTDFGTAQNQRAAEWVADNDTRDDQFTAAQASRTESFGQSETARTVAFNASETGRSNTFTTNENARQAAADANETARNNSYTVAENDREERYGIAESNRSATADADHTRAVGDHNTATDDHGIAESDHVTATADHENYAGLLEDGVLTTQIVDKLTELETTYAPNIVSLTSQLAEAQAQIDLNKRGLGETYPTVVALQTAYPTGDTKDHIVAADGHRYYWNDTAWADGGAYQAVELKNKSVFNPNLSQPLQDYFELYKSYKNVGVSYTGTSDPGNRTWYGLAMLCHSVAVFTKIGIRLTPLNLMGTEYTAELRSGANFNTLLATATGIKQTSGYEFVTFDFGKEFFGDVYVCIKTADGQAPSLDASFLNTSMVTTTDQRYNIESPGGAWVALSGGYNAYLKIEFYTDEYATEAQNLLSRVGQVESDISMSKNDFFSPLMHTILGIGDSLTAGAYDLDALTTTIYPTASYLAMINRLKNVAIVNKGSSGSTTNDYRTLHDADIVACNASAVVIWLGVNDVLKGANAFNGSVADVQGSDYTLYPNTSAGNLGYIIKRAKARNPNAKIFVCNMLKWFNGGTVVTNLNAANVTIAAVADYLDAYLIDLNTLSGLSYALNRDQCFGINGVHLTEYGYAMIAHAVVSVISDVIKNNPSNFRYNNMALN